MDYCIKKNCHLYDIISNAEVSSNNYNFEFLNIVCSISLYVIACNCTLQGNLLL